MADILFVHSNFPAQFGFLAYALTQRGHRVKAIASHTAGRVMDVEIATYPPIASPSPGLRPVVGRIEADITRGEAVLAVGQRLQAQGFKPAVIVGHPGWGETLFLADLFPEAKRVIYGEYYDPRAGGEIGFDPELGPWTLNDRVGGHAVNISTAMSYLEADHIVCPTPFQASLIPASLQPRLSVIHDGVDTTALAPQPNAQFTLPDGRILSRRTPIITYVARKFEPLRGFHILLRALPQVLDALPSAQVLMIGSEGPGYGFRQPAEGWNGRFLGELAGRLDLSRVHFLGKLPHLEMIQALQASSVHVYFTAPFVLSWSLIEAMACGALIVASDTAPVRDAIEDGVSGLLSDFFEPDALASRLILACSRPEVFAPLRGAARQTAVERYDRNRVALPAWTRLIERLI